MNNAIATMPAVQLPAHLQHFAQNAGLASVGKAVLASGVGVSFHRISIKQARWRLNDPQGQEQVLNQLHLDIIVVGANPHISKLYYAKAYNPAESEFVAPDCWSDNGIAPSAQSKHPQCGTCAGCPHNVWGSKITPAGSKTKLCADARKIAVILAENPTGPVYQLKIPAASMSNLVEYTQMLERRGIPPSAIVTRLQFDTQSDYPKILFTPDGGWVNTTQSAAIDELYEGGVASQEIIQVIGTDDKPRDPNQPVTMVAATQAGPDMPAHTPQPNFGVPTPPVQPSSPFSEVSAPATAQPAEAPKRRGRKAAAAPASPPIAEAASPSQAATFFAKTSAHAAKQDIPNAASPAASVSLNPEPTDAALDALIASAMRT